MKGRRTAIVALEVAQAGEVAMLRSDHARHTRYRFKEYQPESHRVRGGIGCFVTCDAIEGLVAELEKAMGNLL